jgi:hypothetical protein
VTAAAAAAAAAATALSDGLRSVEETRIITSCSRRSRCRKVTAAGLHAVEARKREDDVDQASEEEGEEGEEEGAAGRQLE